MGQYNKKKSFGKDRGGRNGGGFRGGKDREQSIHKAVCSDCNKSCEVPFRPTGDKPVFCGDCFGEKKEGGQRNKRKEFSKSNFNKNRRRDADFTPRPMNDNTQDLVDIKRSIDNLNIKLDKLFNVIDIQKETKKEVPKKRDLVKKSIKKTVAKKATPKKAVKKAAKKAVKKTVKKK